jgi:uncharacterized damage-inducible protein DinB
LAASADQSAGDTAIFNLQSRQQEAWNHHDAKPYTRPFAEHAGVVNVLGLWWKGRSEIESKLRGGAKDPHGNPMHLPQKAIQTEVLQKHSGEWLITAFQSTSDVPEIPFPAGPPGNPPAEAKPPLLPQQPTAAEISKKESVASAFLRGLKYQEYEVRSAAEAMPEEKYGYRPAEGKFKDEKPEFGPAEVRTFAEQVKHVACSNFAFAAELDGAKPPEACDKGGPNPAKTRKELLIYLRDSFLAIRKSLGAMDAKNMFDPIEGPYAGPNTRLGLATVVLWHAADHYGQMTLYLRENGIVPPSSRATPPDLQDKY